MNTAFFHEPTLEEQTEIQARIDDALTELKRLNAEMAQEQKDIDRLKLETRDLRVESCLLLEQTQKILAILEAG